MRDSIYPAPNKRALQWVLKNLMGPNVLWLTEALTQIMELKLGMSVLDMGCGKSCKLNILGKRVRCSVRDADLWVKLTENWESIRRAGLDDRVFPLRC